MNILKNTKFFVSFSILLITVGLVIVSLFGFKTSIEYTGGSVLELKIFENYTDKINEVNKVVGFNIKELRESDGVVYLKISDTENSKIQSLLAELKSKVPGIEVLNVEVVGSSVGLEFAKNSFLAIVLAFLTIILYVAYSFSNLSEKISSWYFGIAAIVAVFHDVLAVVSFFSLAGFLYNIEIDALFLTAILTIIGFSINDTIVVFDRFRENFKKYETSKSVSEIFNLSIFETLNRSIITSFVVIVIMFSLFLFGGESIRYFSLAIVIGILVGTYSSIFIATPIVLLLKKLRG